jgi:hypothetical protein
LTRELGAFVFLNDNFYNTGYSNVYILAIWWSTVQLLCCSFGLVLYSTVEYGLKLLSLFQIKRDT